MYICTSCGGNLKFNPSLQMLGCEFCGTTADPYEFEDKGKNIEEITTYDATVFSCPQCGGEILGTDTSIAEFCTFCGASTILNSRLKKEERPKYIIPFKQSKEDCKNSYIKMMKKAIFAPDDLKSEKYIESFRGIYIPYWMYDVEQEGQFILKGSKSHRVGDYVYTDHYDLKGNVSAYYNGFTHDASLSFEDNISEKIAPYDVEDIKEFTPAYLSGFYADSSDVSSSLYAEEVTEIASENTRKEALKHFPGYEKKSNERMPLRIKETKNALLPVWFMAYRNGDRVSYTTINGQTGKAISDIPIDLRKYITYSAGLMIPIFILLNMFLTVIPTMLLTIAMGLALIGTCIYMYEISAIAKKEKERMKQITEADLKSQRTLRKYDSNNIIPILILVGVVIGVTYVIASEIGNIAIDFILVIAVGVVAYIAVKKKKELDESYDIKAIYIPIFAVVCSLIIKIINPVHDMFYYGGVILCAVSIFLTIKDIIFYYNILATHRLPQFNRTGGDDNA